MKILHSFLVSRFSGYLAIGAMVFIAVAAWYVYSKGYVACQKDQAAKTVTAIEKRNEIEHEVLALSDDDITNRLCAKWVRGGCGRQLGKANLP